MIFVVLKSFLEAILWVFRAQQIYREMIMTFSEEELQPKCPICGAQPVHTDEQQKFMICKECGHKENFNDFMEEYEAKLLNEMANSFSQSFKHAFKGNKHIRFTKK